MNQPGDKDITLNQLINPELAVRRAFNEINSESDILTSDDGSITITESVDPLDGVVTKDLSVNFPAEETTASIQAKRPIKTINGVSLEGVGNEVIAQGPQGPQGNSATALIPTWTAIAFVSGAIVNHNKIDYVSTSATLSTDIPGISSVWVERLLHPNLLPKKNLFDKTKAVSGFVFSGGNIAAGDTFRASEFIAVLPSTNYFLSNAANNYRAYYNANKTFISGVFSGSSNALALTTPADCYFIRITCTLANLNITQFELGGSATTFEDFKLIINPIYDAALASDLYNRVDVLEDDSTFIKPEIQTHLSEQDGYMFTNGAIDPNSAFKIRVYDVTGITSVRVQLGTLAASGANAFTFYSVTTGFSSANDISGTTFTTLLANGKDMTVAVPSGALRLLVCELNANISTYTITAYIPTSRLTDIEDRETALELRVTDIETILEENTIICRGDSITAAAYPTNLQTLLGVNYSVVNLGAGSSWIQDISARQGGVPFLLLNDLAIPADNVAQTTVPSSGVYNKYQLTGAQIAPRYDLARAMAEYSPCIIDNEEFVMTLTDPGSSPANVTIRRVNSGDAFTIKAGTPIYPNSLKIYREVLATVFFMGTNNTASHTLDLPTYTDTIINYHNDSIKVLPDSNYIILGLFNLSNRMYNRDLASSAITNAELLAQSVAYELKMQNEFGLHFINLRQLLSSPKAIKDAVRLGYITQGTADANAVNDALWQGRGCAAWSFMEYSGGVDFVHPNTAGYKMIAWYVYNVLKKYLKGV